MIFNEISLKTVPKGLIGKKSALVPAMAWHLTSDKPLPDLILTKMAMPYGITEPEWVKLTKIIDGLWGFYN